MAESGGRATCRVSLYLPLLMALLGCAHTPPAPLAAATQAHLGTIGVVVTGVPPTVDYRTPGAGRCWGGAVIGAAKGVGVGTLGAAGCFVTYGLLWPACGVAVATPYLTVRYAVDQATEGVAANEIERGETAIRAVLVDPRHSAALRDQLYRVAAAHTDQTLVLLPGEQQPPPPEPGTYRHLTPQGIDTVLEITVQRVALEPRQGSGGGLRSLWRPRASDLNPSLTLVVTARTRVVKTAEGSELYGHTGNYSGKGATFTEWGANDAQELRAALDQLFQELSRVVVAQVFGVSIPPANEPEAPAATSPAQEPEFQTQPSPTGLGNFQNRAIPSGRHPEWLHATSCEVSLK